MNNTEKRIIFPRAFAFAIDDLGWNEGSDLSANTPPGPFRAGVKRSFDLNDYRHIVTVAKAVGARIQSLFILGEMDRENLLAKYPTTTYQGRAWDNSNRVNDNQREIMEYVIQEAAFMEFGLHGTGHEYWAEDGIQRRAEWYNLTDHKPWPEESLRDHIKAFKEIMAQYDITLEKGHSFPESFVPCAYSYYWNPDGAYSLGKLLNEAGVKYANTDFSQIPESNPPQEINGGGFDHGTHVINRLNYGNPWYKLDCLPETPIDQQQTDMIESHWPNWLAQDDHLQHDVTSKWINYYLEIQKSSSRYIAKNTEQLHSQWLYNKFTNVKELEFGSIEIDNTGMSEEAYEFNLLGNLVLKVKLKDNEHISTAAINGEEIASYFEHSGYAFLYLPPLQRKIYKLIYTIGASTLSCHLLNDGTYNVYELKRNPTDLQIKLKMYGKQIVKLKCSKPSSIQSSTSDLTVGKWNYDENGYLNVEVSARDMQGSRGIINVEF